jgi:prolyl-tRNA synthetase
LKGVPLRIEIGGRDLAAAAVTVARRDSGEKQQIPLARVSGKIGELLLDVQTSLFRVARDEQERRTLRDPSSYDEMIEFLRDAGGFVGAGCDDRRGVGSGVLKRSGELPELAGEAELVENRL